MLHRYIVFSLTSHSLMETQFVSILAAVDNVSMNTHEHTQCSFDIPFSSGFMLRRVAPHVSTSGC